MLGSIISAGSSLLGGILGSKEKGKDRAMQKEFAQHGIRWKVEDAKAAGLHPLAALGAQSTSYSPVSVGSSDISTGLASAGQDISRAVNATRTSSERVDAYGKTIQDLNIQRMGLENQLLSSQIAKINQAGTPPPMPTLEDRYLVEGQSNSPLVKTKLMDRLAVDPENPESEAGAVADMGFARTKDGWAPVRSKDFMERSEDDWAASVAWNMRNRLGPMLGRTNPPNVPLKSGYMWFFNPVTQEYSQRKIPPRKYPPPNPAWYGFN